jgi:cytochrome c oxidase cbb3-type subunit 1
MSTTPASVVEPRPGSAGREVRAEIDRIVRVPVLLFLLHAVLWLFAGCVLNQIAFIKLYQPEFLTDLGWLSFWSISPALPGWVEGALSYGRLRPAVGTILLYGWAAQAGIGCLVWLLSRLCGMTRKIYPKVLTVLALFWNLAVAICVFSILAGEALPYEYFALPTHGGWVIWVAAALLGLWAWKKLSLRPPGPLYASAWWALAALVAFPVLFLVANVLLAMHPVSGAMQAVVAAWYTHGAFTLWIIPMALAVAYYLVPAASGLTLRAYPMAATGFWVAVGFSAFGGLYSLVNGPVPAWLVTVSNMASVLAVLGWAIAAVNLLGPFRGRDRAELLHHSVALDLSVFGIVCVLVLGALQLVLGIRPLSEMLVNTVFHQGCANLVLFGVSGGIFFAAIYYMVPRLLGRQWPDAALVALHMWGFIYSAVALAVLPLIAGFAQGAFLTSAGSEISPRANSVLLVMPYFFRMYSLAGLMMLVFNGVFIWHVIRYFIALTDPPAWLAEFLKVRTDAEMGRGEVAT